MNTVANLTLDKIRKYLAIIINTLKIYILYCEVHYIVHYIKSIQDASKYQIFAINELRKKETSKPTVNMVADGNGGWVKNT